MRLASPWIAARAAVTPGRTALVTKQGTLSYGALHARARARASGLAGLGVRPGDMVAALIGRAGHFAELLHAVDLCQATLLPLNTRLTPRELAFQLGDSRSRLLLHAGDGFAEKAAAAGRASGVRVERLPDGASPTGPEEDLAASDGELEGIGASPLALLYTSGTSGRPKGALLTRSNFLWSALASAFRLGVAPTDRWLACMPLFHVGGLSILVRSVLYGTAVIAQDRFDPHAASRALDEAGVTRVSLTATMLRRLLEARGPRRAPEHLRCVLLGGGPCPESLVEQATRLGFPVATTYGLTEAASQVATRAPGDSKLRPLLGTQLRVVDDEGRDVPPHAAGEIWVRGPTVMAGYVGRTRDPAPLRPDGWLRTGDVGALDEEGGLEVLDRRSDLIVSGGENVYPAEVEAALLEHPAVAEAGVAGLDDPDYGRRPAAWLVLREGATRPSAETLHGFCRERLAGYKLPVRFHWVPELPRGRSGKLLRRRLGAVRR